MSPQQRMVLALQLQNNTLLGEIIRDCKQAAFDRWRVSGDIQGRELSWLQYQSYETFETQLETMITNIIRDAQAAEQKDGSE